MEDRYPNARDLIVDRFKSVNEFVRLSGLAKTSVVRVIQGKYGDQTTDDTAQRERIEAALREAGVPQQKLATLWATVREKGQSKVLQMNGRIYEFTHVTVVKDLGPAEKPENAK